MSNQNPAHKDQTAPKSASVCAHDPELPCKHGRCEVQRECASEPAITLKDGKPCGHPGCLSHATHPCEGCGRIGGIAQETGDGKPWPCMNASRCENFEKPEVKEIGRCPSCGCAVFSDGTNGGHSVSDCKFMKAKPVDIDFLAEAIGEAWLDNDHPRAKAWIEADRAAQRQAGREEAVEKLSAFLSVCVPVTCKTLADIYDPESNGCLFCPNCAEVCPYLISLEKAKPDAGKEE